MGATMNTHSWLRAVPPTKTAGPMARAGLTLELLHPMPARWMASSATPMARPPEAV